MNLLTRFKDRKPVFSTRLRRVILNPKAWPSAAEGAVVAILFHRGRWVLCCGTLFLGWLLLQPPPTGVVHYQDVLRSASAQLKGQIIGGDIIQDIIGLRELYSGSDPYPRLGPVLAKYGVVSADFISTHPPTAYLLTVPVVALPIAVGLSAWAWLMLAMYVISYRQFGFPWLSAIGLAPITLLWPPAVFSLAQLTPIWLLAVAVAYRHKAGVLSGLAVGIASLTKFLPAILLFPFILQRSVRTVLAFCCVWVVAIAAVLAINQEAVLRYLTVRGNLLKVILWPENDAPLAAAYRWVGTFAVDPEAFLRYLSGKEKLAEILLRADDTAAAFRFSGTAGAMVVFLFLALLVALTWRRHGWPMVLILAAYVSVAALPIAWIYSTLPLLPVFGFFLCGGNMQAKMLAAVSFVILCICPRFGLISVPYVAGSIVLLGTCFIWPVRSTWLKQGSEPNYSSSAIKSASAARA